MNTQGNERCNAATLQSVSFASSLNWCCTQKCSFFASVTLCTRLIGQVSYCLQLSPLIKYGESVSSIQYFMFLIGGTIDLLFVQYG